jgi:hypothetical protein
MWVAWAYLVPGVNVGVAAYGEMDVVWEEVNTGQKKKNSTPYTKNDSMCDNGTDEANPPIVQVSGARSVTWPDNALRNRQWGGRGVWVKIPRMAVVAGGGQRETRLEGKKSTL